MEEGMMEASQEAPVQQTASPTESASKPAPEQAGHDELDFFGEAVTEAELRGQTPDKAHGREQTETPAPEEPQPEAKPGDEPAGKDAPSGEDKPADGAKPPKGFVPHAALSEERTKRKEAQQRVEQLEQELAARKVPHEQRQTPEAPKDASEAARKFAEQNPQYAALVFEDSRDGRLLRDKLDTYGEEDAIVLAKTRHVERELAEQKRREAGSADAAFLSTCVREMDAMFEGGLNGQQAKELIGYLQNEAGLTPDTITLLTSPNTIVIDPRTGRQSYLGGRALEVVGLFKDAHTLSAVSNPERVREAIEAEVTKKVMQKINGEQTAFRELGDAPGHGDAPIGHIPATEEAFARLSPEQQERLLRGEL